MLHPTYCSERIRILQCTHYTSRAKCSVVTQTMISGVTRSMSAQDHTWCMHSARVCDGWISNAMKSVHVLTTRSLCFLATAKEMENNGGDSFGCRSLHNIGSSHAADAGAIGKPPQQLKCKTGYSARWEVQHPWVLMWRARYVLQALSKVWHQKPTKPK